MRALIFAFVALFAASCAPSLGAFNRLAPKDGGAEAVRDIAYGEGPRRMLDIYAPRKAEAPAPVIVFFYGGSWSSGARGEYEFVGRAFAAQGFVTIIPDYRLAPEVRFPSFIEDGAAAVRWAEQHAAEHGGDPARIVLAGHSAGAYIATMLALDAHYLADAGVDASHLRGVAGLSGPYDFLPLDVKASIDAFSAAPDLAATQPINFARADAPPLLLLWGARDETVAQRSIDGLSRAVAAAGGRVETKIYPRVGHIDLMLALSRPLRGRAPVLADVSDFARRVAD
jgi:acetyl esterase/lipase